MIETIRIRPPSKITSWAGWPEDVHDTLRDWNKRRGLSFRYISASGERKAFRCTGCQEWHEASSSVAVLKEKAYCDGCLIILARGALHEGATND